jgi:hypothetical protein
MKKLLLVLGLVVSLSGLVFAENITNEAGTTIRIQKVTASSGTSGAAVSGRGAFYGILVKTDGTNNATVSVNDSNGGPELIPNSTIIPGTTRLAAITFDPPLKYTMSVYVTISGTGASYQVLYDN